MDLQLWPGAVVMMLIATMAAALVTSRGRSTWFVGVFVPMVYLVFAMTLYLLPPPCTLVTALILGFRARGNIAATASGLEALGLFRCLYSAAAVGRGHLVSCSQELALADTTSDGSCF